MTYAEAKFYESDKREYDIENNREFLNWLINSMEDGVRLDHHLNIKDFEGLIDSVVAWYELKYPGYTLEPYYGNLMAERIESVPNISSMLDGKQFLYRLPYRQYWLMNIDFVDDFNVCECDVYENGHTIKKNVCYANVKGKDSEYEFSYDILFDLESGVILKSNFMEFIGKTLEDMVSLLKKNGSIADYSDLENALKKYQFKMELRHRLLQLAALKILYKSESKDMGPQTPCMGYMRAKKFINEFNEDFDLLLSSSEIDNLFIEYALEDRKFKPYGKSLKS